MIYRQPIGLRFDRGQWTADPVCAILAGPEAGSFAGSKANFRDIIQVAKDEGRFIYVIPAGNVTRQPVWRGYVRLGYQKWIAVPCPRAQAIYNRVPTRNLERSTAVMAAKRTLQSLQIPVFNPEYFNKKVIYAALERSSARRYVPETVRLDSQQSVEGMTRRNQSVYLKPTGGSIGHGIMRIDVVRPGRYQLSVLKNSVCSVYEASGFSELWNMVRKHRLGGEYVLQAGKELIRFRGRPCDFRVLVQKHKTDWQVTGIGVRVSGPNTITTHVPNGGSIASADAVLTSAFGDGAQSVERSLETMVRDCAQVIDNHYRGQLGEMSMDIGVDGGGNLWFFEANAKPMKFDEPDIRRKSIRGVIDHLEYLALKDS